MDEQKVRQIAKQEIVAHDSSARFSLNPIQRHTHNGVDSPPILSPIVTYIGIVSPGFQAFLPKGWSIETSSTGVFTLRTDFSIGTTFSVVATTELAGIIPSIINVVVYAVNEIEFDIVDLAGSFLDAKFYFNITVINSRSLTLPSYNTTNL